MMELRSGVAVQLRSSLRIATRCLDLGSFFSRQQVGVGNGCQRLRVVAIGLVCSNERLVAAVVSGEAWTYSMGRDSWSIGLASTWSKIAGVPLLLVMMLLLG